MKSGTVAGQPISTLTISHKIENSPTNIDTPTDTYTQSETNKQTHTHTHTQRITHTHTDTTDRHTLTDNYSQFSPLPFQTINLLPQYHKCLRPNWHLCGVRHLGFVAWLPESSHIDISLQKLVGLQPA